MANFVRVLNALWQQWKRIARKIGDFQARVLLNVFYFLIFMPFALIVRWGTDPLAIKPRGEKGWRPRSQQEGSPLEKAARQF